MKQLICNPKIKSQTCVPDTYTYKMKQIWNKKKTRKITTKNPKHILIRLAELNKDCGNKLCLIKKIFHNNPDLYKNIKKNYAPTAPSIWKSDINTWLSTNDIRDVLNQYEESNSNFKFIGPSPIDWEHKKNIDQCVCNKLCNIDLQSELKNGINKIGIVFNLDEHDMSGSHWVAVFINSLDKHFYFFDSQGFRCPHRIKKLFHKINFNKDFHFFSNFNIIHQKKKSECGVYCIYFIIHMLKNNDFHHFTKPDKTIPDDQMQKKRYEYYNIL